MFFSLRSTRTSQLTQVMPPMATLCVVKEFDESDIVILSLLVVHPGATGSRNAVTPHDDAGHRAVLSRGEKPAQTSDQDGRFGRGRLGWSVQARERTRQRQIHGISDSRYRNED